LVLICRATFIIDTTGVIRHKSINDLPVGRNVDEVLRLVKAFQFVDKHGEVCPASWKPGDPTVIWHFILIDGRKARK
jgi:peroxiredoxin (alkyl hydroperoxide reductase subunit C)